MLTKTSLFFLLISLIAGNGAVPSPLKPPNSFEKNAPTGETIGLLQIPEPKIFPQGTSLRQQSVWEPLKIRRKSTAKIKLKTPNKKLIEEKKENLVGEDNHFKTGNELNPAKNNGEIDKPRMDKDWIGSTSQKNPNRISKKLFRQLLLSDKFKQILQNSPNNSTLKSLLKGDIRTSIQSRKDDTNTSNLSRKVDFKTSILSRQNDIRGKRLAEAKRAKAQYEFRRKTKRLLGKKKRKKERKKRILLFYKNGVDGQAKRVTFEGKSLGKVRLPLRDEPLYEYETYGNFVNKNGVQTPKTREDPIFFIQLVDGESAEEENELNEEKEILLPEPKVKAKSLDFYTDPDYLRLPLHKLHGPPYDHYRVRYVPKDPFTAGPEEDPFYKNYVDPPQGFKTFEPASLLSLAKIQSVRDFARKSFPQIKKSPKIRSRTIKKRVTPKRRTKIAKSLTPIKEKIQRRSFTHTTPSPQTRNPNRFASHVFKPPTTAVPRHNRPSTAVPRHHKPSTAVPRHTSPTTGISKQNTTKPRSRKSPAIGFTSYSKGENYLQTPPGYFTLPIKDPNLTLTPPFINSLARDYKTVSPTRNYKGQKLPKSISKRNNGRKASKVKTEKPKNRLKAANKKKHPTYSKIPKTSFTCRDKKAGMYADVEAECQVWHTCETDTRQHAFLCPNGTIFSQKLLTCDWWYNVDCYKSFDHLDESDILQNLATSSKISYAKAPNLAISTDVLDSKGPELAFLADILDIKEPNLVTSSNILDSKEPKL